MIFYLSDEFTSLALVPELKEWLSYSFLLSGFGLIIIALVQSKFKLQVPSDLSKLSH